MALEEASIHDVQVNPFDTVAREWLLVSAGGPDKMNMMTASWGALGAFWGKPAITCYIRETRYTKQFVDRCPRFGISVLPEQYRDALKICGTKSGRDIDKVAATGLTPKFVDGVPVFQEAKLAFVCKKAYAQFMPPTAFVDPDAKANWYSRGESDRNYHTAYIGTVEHVLKQA